MAMYIYFVDLLSLMIGNFWSCGIKMLSLKIIFRHYVNRQNKEEDISIFLNQDFLSYVFSISNFLVCLILRESKKCSPIQYSFSSGFLHIFPFHLLSCQATLNVMCLIEFTSTLFLITSYSSFSLEEFNSERYFFIDNWRII